MTKKIKLKISARLMRKKLRSRGGVVKRHCRFCGNDTQIGQVDYKNAVFLRGFLTERGKILASRISGSCSLHQRKLSREIKKARTIALLPYIAPWAQ
jgi:small subunit ribosomal protein S18